MRGVYEMENPEDTQDLYANVPQPIRNDGAGGYDTGPRDIMRDLENPDLLVPPETDAGLLPNMKFSFSDTSMTFRAGDVGYVPFANGHYIQNTGTETLWFLEMFKSDRFVDVSLNQWMARTPRDLVRDNLHVGPELLDALCKVESPVVKYPGFSYYPK
jgi:hypothetical protein